MLVIAVARSSKGQQQVKGARGLGGDANMPRLASKHWESAVELQVGDSEGDMDQSQSRQIVVARPKVQTVHC